MTTSIAKRLTHEPLSLLAHLAYVLCGFGYMAYDISAIRGTLDENVSLWSSVLLSVLYLVDALLYTAATYAYNPPNGLPWGDLCYILASWVLLASQAMYYMSFDVRGLH
jgi:hypothetical protein